MSRKRPNYPSPLNEPISLEHFTDPVKGFPEYWRRIDLLRQHYGIAESDRGNVFYWQLLALSLARDHVPGLGFKRPPGRRATQTGRDLMLVGAMAQEINAGKSVAKAAAAVVADAEAKGRHLGLDAEGARQRFQKIFSKTPEGANLRAKLRTFP